MSFIPYFVCALLGVDSLRGGLAEGNRIFIGHTFAIQGVEPCCADVSKQSAFFTAPLVWGFAALHVHTPRLRVAVRLRLGDMVPEDKDRILEA